MCDKIVNARALLRIKIGNYSWYSSSKIVDDYILVKVKRLNKSITNTIPSIIEGVIIKTELEG